MVKLHKIKWRKVKKFYCVVDLYWQTGLKNFIIDYKIDFAENTYCNQETFDAIKNKMIEVYQTYDILESKNIYGNKRYKKRRKSKRGLISFEDYKFIEKEMEMMAPQIDNELKDNCIKIIY